MKLSLPHLKKPKNLNGIVYNREGWGTFAYVPVDPAGNGSFYFSGARRILKGATHVYAHCLSSDFSYFEDIAAEIPAKFLHDSCISENA